jgi:hypothetical protein
MDESVIFNCAKRGANEHFQRREMRRKRKFSSLIVNFSELQPK